MTHNFIEIIPQARSVFPIQDMDLDAPRSLNLLGRPQRAQRVGWENPAELILSDKFDLFIPIKAPGTNIFIPEWLSPRGAFQKIADFRAATSQRYEHEWMHMLYEHTYLHKGEPVRRNAGKHIDDDEHLLIKGEGRVTANFLMASSLNTVFYDGLKNFDAREYAELLPVWDRITDEDPDDIDPIELARVRNAYFDSRVYPAEGRNWPAGTIVCTSGVTPHEPQLADGNYVRAFLHITAYEGHSVTQEEGRVRRDNPALAKVYFG